MDTQQEITEIAEIEPSGKRQWKYRESFIILLMLLAVGFLLELLTKKHSISLPQMPFSLYVGCMFATGIILLYLNYRNTLFIEWLSGIPAAISAIAGYLAFLLCIGLIKQKTTYSGILQDLGLTHIKVSYPFILIQIYLLTILGVATLKRLFPIRLKNIAFFLSHLGLWITMVSAGLGSGDLKRLHINLLENENESNIGLSANDEMFKLPFSAKLLDFTIEEYSPTLVIKDREGKICPDSPRPAPSADKGGVVRYKNWFIYIEKYIPNAVFDSTFRSTDLPGSYPVAYLEVVDIKQKKKSSGWISVGNLYQEPLYFWLDSTNFVAFTLPYPKRIYSKLAIAHDSTASDTVMLEVNKPIEIEGWKLYQSSYDLSKGKWSTLSVLEAVKDPWLPVVYAGLVTLFIGTFLMIWTGKNKQ